VALERARAELAAAEAAHHDGQSEDARHDQGTDQQQEALAGRPDAGRPKDIAD
jgi:hypothetical protein